MGSDIRVLTQSPVGRVAYWPLQKLIRFVRRLRYPELPMDHALISVSYRGRQFRIEVRRWNSSDHSAVRQCFSYAQYDMPQYDQGKALDRLYREIVDAGKRPLIVDCGANVGASVLWFTARYPEAHIIAVEPASDNFSLLEKNTRGLDVELYRAGVGPEDGTAWLSNPNGDAGMDYRTNSVGEGVKVKIVSLAMLLMGKLSGDLVPFLLKVDIEGAEKDLFTGDTSLINRFPLIILEPHDWLLPGQATSLPFLRFHVEAKRELALKLENIASVRYTL